MRFFWDKGPHSGRTYKLQVYTATVADGTLTLSDEHDSAEWFKPVEALNLDLTTQTRKAILALKEKALEVFDLIS